MMNQATHSQNHMFVDCFKDLRKQIKHRLGQIRSARPAQNDPNFNDKSAYNVIGKNDIASLLHTTAIAVVKSDDGKRSITVDPVELTIAFQCVHRLMDVNPHFIDYDTLRKFVTKFERQFMISFTSQSNAAQKHYVECLARSINNQEALFELLAVAPDDSDEKMALDLLFFILEG